MHDWNDQSDAIENIEELLDLGLYEEAEEQLERALELYPDEGELLYLFSRAWSERDQPQKALPYLLKALQLDKTNVDCLLGLFYTYVQLNQLTKGAHYLFQAEKYYGDNELVLSGLIWYYTETNDLAKAVSYFNRARQREITQAETLRNAALAFERLGEYDYSEQCLVTALQIDPFFESVRDFLADHYVGRGVPEKSVELYRDYLKISPDNVRALSRLAFSLSQIDEFEEAANTVRYMIGRYPNSPVGYIDMAYLCLNTERPKEALDYIEKALGVSPLAAEAYRVRGIIFSEQEKFSEADAAFTEALSLDPKNPEIKRDYYHHLRAAGNFEKMEQVVREVAQEEFPYCTEDYWFLADYYREAGNNRTAFNFLHKAYKNMPGERELIPPMVDILLDEGHLSYLVPYLMRYIERAGWNEDVMEYYGRHSRLKNRAAQEGLRMLRFYGQKGSLFRRYIFKVYLQRYFRTALLGILPLAAALLYLVFALKGLLWLGMGYLVVITAAFGMKIGNAWQLQGRLSAFLSPQIGKKKAIAHEPG
ncbi:MAG: tetratricopeptide repeat protein [Chitinivibrionales bacterium]|nr:tetratricopeptide repeat protein [Chitinivibrionales bacterium]